MNDISSQSTACIRLSLLMTCAPPAEMPGGGTSSSTSQGIRAKSAPRVAASARGKTRAPRRAHSDSDLRQCSGTLQWRQIVICKFGIACGLLRDAQERAGLARAEGIGASARPAKSGGSKVIQEGSALG